MNQSFFKIKFEDKNVIDYDMFREINEVIAKIRFEGYGKILAPRYGHYDKVNEDIVNNLGNKMYAVLYILHSDEDGLTNIIKNEIKNLGHTCSYEIEMPDIIEISFDSSKLDDSIKFENEFKMKIKECGWGIDGYSDFKNNYDSAIRFKLNGSMNDFDGKLNEISDFLKDNVGERYFAEYF